MMIDLSKLNEPEIIEPLNFETILAETMADVQQRFARDGLHYDVGHLETDPVKIDMEAGSFRELSLRARINDAAKANLVYFATGSDLDHLAGFYDVFRIPQEKDEPFRGRVIASISGRSPAGGSDWYRSAALRSDIRVADAAVYRFGDGPDIRVAVLSTDNYGEADAALIEAVRREIQKDNVRVISDRVSVLPATTSMVSIDADIWLMPDTPQESFGLLENSLRMALLQEGGLGFDLTRSWIISKLHQPGVHKVVLKTPMQDIAVDEYSAAKLSEIKLTYMGRGR